MDGCSICIHFTVLVFIWRLGKVKVIEKSLSNLGLSNLTNIRQGKLIELDISDTLSEEEKNDLITSACKKLLVNEIIEEYEVLG